MVVAERLDTSTREECLEARLPMTGEVLVFPLADLDAFAVLP